MAMLGSGIAALSGAFKKKSTPVPNTAATATPAAPAAAVVGSAPYAPTRKRTRLSGSDTLLGGGA